jgi:hypothetical protein
MVPQDAVDIQCFECSEFPHRRKIVLRCVELASAPGRYCSVAGQYLESMDFNAHDGGGSAKFTDDLNKAKKFGNMREAIAYYRGVPKVRPMRGDGQPNRPLTAFTMELSTVGRALRQVEHNGSRKS